MQGGTIVDTCEAKEKREVIVSSSNYLSSDTTRHQWTGMLRIWEEALR